MPGDLARYIASSAVERQHNQALAGYDRQADAASARMAAVTSVTQDAMICTLRLALGRRAAEQLAPETAGQMELLTNTAVIAMAGELQHLQSRLR